jgi:Asp-tRNA(Asn)/Glu-tRNA(Gln) amidotransferase A subunit family amidase
MASNLDQDYAKVGEQLSAVLRALIERGRGRLAIDYAKALSAVEPLNTTLDSVFEEYDAILTPAAPGPAPLGEATGNPVFCSIWTYLGAPAITLPLMATEDGMPLGVQLVGRRGNDARLLRTARWLVKTLAGGGRKGAGKPGNRRKGRSE